MITTLRVSVRRGSRSAKPPSTRPRFTRPGEALIVAIGGELDIATAPRFAARFEEFLSAGLRHIVIDVNKLTFVDVTGLRALVTLRAQAEQRLIAVRLSGVSPQMRRLMGIIGPARDFPSSDRTAAAAAEAED